MLRVSHGRFVYIDEQKRIGECLVDVLLNNERFVVIFTEIAGNPGPSVTNAIEHIIDQFCKQNSLALDEADFYERYHTHPDDLDAIVFGSHKRWTVSQCPEVLWRRLEPNTTKQILEALAA